MTQHQIAMLLKRRCALRGGARVTSFNSIEQGKRLRQQAVALLVLKFEAIEEAVRFRGSSPQRRNQHDALRSVRRVVEGLQALDEFPQQRRMASRLPVVGLQCLIDGPQQLANAGVFSPQPTVVEHLRN